MQPLLAIDKVRIGITRSFEPQFMQMTGTLRTDPTQPLPGRRRPFLPLNNKCMELRKVPAVLL